MQTDPVSRLNQVMLLLRQQLLSRAGRERSGVVPASSTPARSSRSARGAKKDLDRLTSVRLATLRNAGVKSSSLLKRAFIEQILISGLGEHLVNEARFQDLVDEVLKTLTQDPELGLLLEVAIGAGASIKA